MMKDDIFRGGDHNKVTHSLKKAKAALLQGPIAMAFEVHRAFLTYRDGVYDAYGAQGQGMHSVRVIGYGPDYFLAVNSWGSRWGDKGHFKIRAGCCKMVFFIPGKPVLAKSALPLAKWKRTKARGSSHQRRRSQPRTPASQSREGAEKKPVPPAAP